VVARGRGDGRRGARCVQVVTRGRGDGRRCARGVAGVWVERSPDVRHSHKAHHRAAL